jgi:hypothetical protein
MIGHVRSGYRVSRRQVRWLHFNRDPHLRQYFAPAGTGCLHTGQVCAAGVVAGGVEGEPLAGEPLAGAEAGDVTGASVRDSPHPPRMRASRATMTTGRFPMILAAWRVGAAVKRSWA